MMNEKLSKFGSAEFPLRASSLPLLLTCPMRAALLFLKEFEDDVGAAAHTGSAVHKAVEFWHDMQNYDRAIEYSKEHERDYPKVDWREVELYFRPYTLDPRNIQARILAKEKPVTFTLQEERPLGTLLGRPLIEMGDLITITGTLDQIRLVNSRKILYDLKTGKTYSAIAAMNVYACQLAAYWLGAIQSGIDVDSIGIISPYAYRSRGAQLPSPDGVFWESSMTLDSAKDLMKSVVRTVNAIRRAEVDVRPGPSCNFCPAQSASICLPIGKGLSLV